MATSLCETFRALAFKTFDHMARAKRVGHQPLEETFTDTNILELKDRHTVDVYSKTFTKHQEGVHGADWEWWITNSTKSSWLGLRIQAKVLNLKSDRFEHLHYRSGKSKIYQLRKLKSQCKKEGLVPLYCFYSYLEPEANDLLLTSIIHSKRFPSESFGCSLASLSHIESLHRAGLIDNKINVLSKALPWHCLICDSAFSSDDLPNRVWGNLRFRFNIKNPKPKKPPTTGDTGLDFIPGPRPYPPPHVIAAMDGQEPDVVPKGLRGLVILVGGSSGQE